MGIRLVVEGSTIKKPMALGHRRTGVLRSSLPHLLTQQGSGESKGSGSPTHRSAFRKNARAESLGHTTTAAEKPETTATTPVPGKGKKGKAKSATALVCLTLQKWEHPNIRVGHIFNRSLGVKKPEAWGNTTCPKCPHPPRATCSPSPSQVSELTLLSEGHE